MEKEAFNSEFDSQQEHQTYKVVPKPISSTVIPMKFVFQRKKNSDGIVCRYKARPVAKGYRQDIFKLEFHR